MALTWQIARKGETARKDRSRDCVNFESDKRSIERLLMRWGLRAAMRVPDLSETEERMIRVFTHC